MRKILIIFLVFNFLCSPAFSLEFDTSIDEEIRKNYNPNKLNEDMGLPPLPKITDEPYKEPLKPVNVVAMPPTVERQAVKKNVVQPQKKASVSYKKNSSLKKPQVSYITLKKGTKIKVRNLNHISDRTRKGTKLSFTSLYPVSTTYFTLPIGTVFKGEVVDSHKPQLSANGGLIKIRVSSVSVNNDIQPINAYVTKANNKHIFLNSIKGKRRYLASVCKSTTPGRRFFSKMMKVTSNLAQDGSSILVAPFSLIIGLVGVGGNIVISPALGLLKKGGAVNIPEGSIIELKLSEDVFIYN